jgi:hypothetical protein
LRSSAGPDRPSRSRSRSISRACPFRLLSSLSNINYYSLAADHLVLVVLACQDLERGLDDPAPQAEDKVQGGLLLDVVVRQRAAVLQLLARKDEALLVGGDA